MSTAIITSIYQPFWGTEAFLKSCEKHGYTVYNTFKKKYFSGNGDVIRMIYDQLLELKGKYETVIYADGADSLVVSHFDPPTDHILWSTEKAVWEPFPSLQARWMNYYQDMAVLWGKPMVSPWKYLNGGGYCGPVELLIEHFEKYGFNKQRGDMAAQSFQANAFLDAKAAGFPIRLDTNCNYFQTTGFEHEGDFELADGQFKNLITGTTPSILHGNGRTDMKRFYEYFK